MNAGEGGLVIFPGIFGSPIDPSTPMEDRDVAQLGTGLWNRMLHRRHPLLEARAPSGVGRRALPAHRAPVPRRRGARARPLVGVRARRPVKITELQAIPLAIPHRPMTPPSPWSASLAKQILVRVATDEGLVGLGRVLRLRRAARRVQRGRGGAGAHRRRRGSRLASSTSRARCTRR